MESFLTDLWEAAKVAGPFGTMFAVIAYIRSDRERLKLQGERNALLERTLTANESLSRGIDDLVELIKDDRNGGRRR